MQHLGCRVRFRIKDGNEIRAVLSRCVNLPVRVNPRIAPVGRDLIVEIGRGSAPVPQGDYDIPLDALWPLGLRERQLAGGDTISPIGEEFERHVRIEPRDIPCHERPSATGLNSPRPCLDRILELAESFWYGAYSFGAEGVARLAGAGLYDVEPCTLARNLGQRKLALLRYSKHRKPVNCRIVFRRLPGSRCNHRVQVDDLPRHRLYLRRINQAVASYPHVVIRLGKIRHHVAASIIGNYDFRELGGKIGRLRNHPHARFRPLSAGDHSAEISAANAYSAGGVPLTIQLSWRYSEHQYCDAGYHQPDMNHCCCLHVSFLSSLLEGKPVSHRVVADPVRAGSTLKSIGRFRLVRERKE